MSYKINYEEKFKVKNLIIIFFRVFIIKDFVTNKYILFLKFCLSNNRFLQVSQKMSHFHLIQI